MNNPLPRLRDALACLAAAGTPENALKVQNERLAFKAWRHENIRLVVRNA